MSDEEEYAELPKERVGFWGFENHNPRSVGMPSNANVSIDCLLWFRVTCAFYLCSVFVMDWMRRPDDTTSTVRAGFELGTWSLGAVVVYFCLASYFAIYERVYSELLADAEDGLRAGPVAWTLLRRAQVSSLCVAFNLAALAFLAWATGLANPVGTATVDRFVQAHSYGVGLVLIVADLFLGDVAVSPAFAVATTATWLTFSIANGIWCTSQSEIAFNSDVDMKLDERTTYAVIIGGFATSALLHFGFHGLYKTREFLLNSAVAGDGSGRHGSYYHPWRSPGSDDARSMRSGATRSTAASEATAQ